MKSALKLALLTLTLAIGIQATAQTAPKIAVIDLKKVFDGYWRTKQADVNLKDRAGDFDKSRKSMVEDYQKANDDYKKLVESSNDQAVSNDEREKRKKLADVKLQEIREIENQINQFDRQTRANLGEQQRRLRDNIVRDIREVINAKAKAAGYTLVIDSTGETVTGTPVVLFNAGGNDLSDEVLAQINATAPATLPKTEDKPAATTTTPTPAAKDAKK